MSFTIDFSDSDECESQDDLVTKTDNRIPEGVRICPACGFDVKHVGKYPSPHTPKGDEYTVSHFVLHEPVCPGKKNVIFKTNRACEKSTAIGAQWTNTL